MLAHVACVVNEAGVIFQVQVRVLWHKNDWIDVFDKEEAKCYFKDVTR